MPRTLDSSLPLKGFGPSKDGQGFGKIARQRQAVMDHVGGLPEHLLPILPPPEDLEAVEQLIKKSSNVEKRRRRRKQSRDSADSESGDSARKRVGRSKSTPLLDGPGGGSHAGKGANGGGASPEKPRRRRHRTPEPEPLTRRQFEVACEALHLPAVPGAQPKPGQPAAGVWFDRLGSSDKMAMRRVLERNGARAAIIVAELPEPTEKSVQKRVQKRVSAEKDAFQVVLERNRRVRSENGRVSNGRSRRSRLLDTGSSFGSSEEDSLDEELNSTLFRTEPKLKPLSEGEKLNLLDETPVTRAEPNQLWVGHIPDDAAKSGKDHLEERLRKLCRNYGQITDVTAHPRFDDLDCSRPDDQSWAIVTFKPGTMLHFMEILRAEVRMGGKLLVLQLAKEEIVEQFAESSGSLKRSDGMKQVDFALSPRHTLEEEMENYTRAHTQIHNHKMDVLDEELPDIGEEDRESGGLANEAAAPAEAIVQWISRIESLMEAKNYTLSLPGYGMGDGGSAALVTAIATIEKLNMDDLEHHEEVPQPSHIFRKLILSSNSLSPTDEQTAAAVADNHIGNGGSPGKLSVGKLSAKIQHTKLHGGTTKPQQLDGDSDADQEAPPDFDAQARELRKIKNRRTLQRRQAVHRIQRAYRKATGTTLNAGVSLFEKDALEVNSAPKSSGCDNIGMLLSLYVADIRKLDLSDNPLGIAGGRIIAEALDGHCPVKLKKLLLRDCKLTDQGAGAIIAVVLEQAPALTKLDLRKNGLGNDQRGDRGASAALHDLFVEGCCEVQSLKLGYNNLRPQHVRHFSPALREEKTLVYLDLAWNSLGDDGAMWLAHALRQNTTLLALDVTHNEIKEKGCFVIADMLKENRGLERIRLNENPIGERGARAILRTIRKLILYGWQREISVANCNMYYTSKDQIFDPQEAGGFHSCNLADPYQRSVAWGLVELAWDEDGENWIGETHDGKPYDLDEPPPGEIWTREKFQLPITGELSLTYFSTMRVARYGDVIEDPMLHQLLILMTHKSVTDGGVKLLKLAALEFFFTASMVGNLISLMKDSVSRAEVACALLPRIVDPVNVIAETYDVLTDGELATMEKNMGKLFHFNPVNPTGHYTLQLANSFDRVLIRRLAEITEEQGSLRREQELLDTSQKGDWDNFRNETLNGRPFDFDVEILSAGGMTAGVLEFDFVSTDSNHRQALLPPMPDDVFELFLDELWQTRNKVKLPVAEGISNREGGTILVEQPFSIRFPEAEYALRKQRDERTETDIQAILSMLKKLEFPIKALAAVQRMCAVASYKFVPAGENVITGGEKGDDIYVLLHGSLQVLGASYIEDASAKDNQAAFVRIYPGQFIGEMAYLGGTRARGATVRAEVDVHLLELTINDLKEVNMNLSLFERGESVATTSGCIFVDVVSATDLLAMDKTGFSDPYITCTIGSQVATTSVQRQTLTPEWDERLEFRTGVGDTLSIECFDWDLKGDDDPMGDASLDLNVFGEETKTVETTLLLDGERVGSVTLRLRRWEPKYTQLEAVAMLQRAFRGYKDRNRFMKFLAAKKTMVARTKVAATMTQERVSQRADLLRKKQKNLQQQEWAQTTVGSSLNRTTELASTTDGVEAGGATDGKPVDIKSAQRPTWEVQDDSSDSSEEEDMLAPTPMSDLGSAKAGIKDRIDWFRPDWMDQLIAQRAKLASKTRQPWFVPSAKRTEVVRTMKEKRAVVFERTQQLVRRASMQYYFCTQQVLRMLETVHDDATYKDNDLVSKPVGLNHVEMLTSVFSRITDVENLDFREILGHTTYDADGNHSVSVDEIVYLRQYPPPYVILTDRLGVANMFNPLRPDGEYALNLRVRDERQVAQMLVLLSTEPGDNMVYETFNGVPFDVGLKWLTAVPDVGWFCLQYVTPPACASLALRTSLARRLVNPGKGRWKCIPREQRMHRDDPTLSMWQTEVEDKDLVHESEIDLPGPGEWVVDSDGTLTQASTTMMAAEQAAAEQKRVRKEARKAREAKLAAMAEEERADAVKAIAAEQSSLLGRKLSEGDSAEWVTYSDVKSAATALGLREPDVIKAARGQIDSTGGYEFTYAEKSRKQGLSLGVSLSLLRINKKWTKKIESTSPSEGEGLSGSPTVTAEIDKDDIAAVLEVAKAVDTAKMHWRRLRRVTRMMMLLRSSGVAQGGGGGPKLGALAQMMSSGNKSTDGD